MPTPGADITFPFNNEDVARMAHMRNKHRREILKRCFLEAANEPELPRIADPEGTDPSSSRANYIPLFQRDGIRDSPEVQKILTGAAVRYLELIMEEYPDPAWKSDRRIPPKVEVAQSLWNMQVMATLDPYLKELQAYKEARCKAHGTPVEKIKNPDSKILLGGLIRTCVCMFEENKGHNIVTWGDTPRRAVSAYVKTIPVGHETDEEKKHNGPIRRDIAKEVIAGRVEGLRCIWPPKTTPSR